MKRFFLPLILAILIGAVSIPAYTSIDNYIKRTTPKYHEVSQWVNYRVDNEFHATVYISLINALEVCHVFEEISDKGIKSIDLVMLSPGGSLIDMWAIVDMIQRVKAQGVQLRTHAMGMIASAAVPIYLLGDVRTMGKNAVMMLHPSSLHGKTLQDFTYGDVEEGNPTDRTLFRKMDKYWNIKYAKLVAARTELDFDTAMKYITTGDTNTGQWWFTAREAMLMGFAQKLI